MSLEIFVGHLCRIGLPTLCEYIVSIFHIHAQKAG
jgi:hypothetical protein